MLVIEPTVAHIRMAPHLGYPKSFGWNSLGWILVVAGGAELGLTFATDARNKIAAEEIPLISSAVTMLSTNEGKGGEGLGVVGLRTTGVGLFIVGVIRA